MSRPTAFDAFFDDVQVFTDGTLVVSGEKNFRDVEQLFLDEVAALMEDQRYAIHYIRENMYRSVVKFHAGQNEDGEMQNMWWLHDDWMHDMTNGKGRRRATRLVWALSPDRHYIQFGHMYHPQIEPDGTRRHLTTCDLCVKLSERSYSHE